MMKWDKKKFETCARCGVVFVKGFGKKITVTDIAPGSKYQYQYTYTHDVWYCWRHVPRYDRRDDSLETPRYYLNCVPCDEEGNVI